MAKKTKVHYVETNLLPERIEPKDEKSRISIIMEEDLLDALKARAKELGRPYQTLMKEILRQNLQIEIPRVRPFLWTDLAKR
ncbi:CopG family antitoxin [Bdellovibrionota bacterium FG-2]